MKNFKLGFLLACAFALLGSSNAQSEDHLINGIINMMEATDNSKNKIQTTAPTEAAQTVQPMLVNAPMKEVKEPVHYETPALLASEVSIPILPSQEIPIVPKPTPVDVGRLDRVAKDLKNSIQETRNFKNDIIKNISITIDDVAKAHAKQEELDLVVYKNRLQNLVLRMNVANPEQCFKGNSDYAGPYKSRSLSVLKCSDDASRLISVNRQWAMIESFGTNIYKHATTAINNCQSETNTFNACFEKAVDQFERLVSGAKTMLHDFTKYSLKIVGRIEKRYDQCYSQIDYDVLTRFVMCLKKGQVVSASAIDYSERIKNARELTNNIPSLGETEQNLPMDQIPLRRRFGY